MQRNQKILYDYQSSSMGDLKLNNKRRNSFWIIDGHEYLIESVVGAGVYGEVSKYNRIGKESKGNGIASKKIKYNPSNQTKAVKQIENEIELTAIRYGFAYGKHFPMHYTYVFSMPFIPGNTYKVVEKHGIFIDVEYNTRAKFLQNYFKILVEVYFLHVQFGIMHGDLKFSNLKIHNGQVYLLDFGLSSKIGEMTIATDPSIYRAPELVNSIKADPISDVFSLGWMLSFFDKFVNAFLKIRDQTSTDLLMIPELKSLYDKMTQRDPNKRIALLPAIQEYVGFFNKSEFGKNAPIKFKASSIKQDFKPSSLPEAVSIPSPINNPSPLDPATSKLEETTTTLEDTLLKRRLAKPTLAPPPSPASDLDTVDPASPQLEVTIKRQLARPTLAPPSSPASDPDKEKNFNSRRLH